MPDSNVRRAVDRRVIRTKKSIKKALFEITEAKDISDVTVSELARKAGVNRRTFYTHYASITEIVDEIENELVDAIRDIALNFHEDNFRESIYNVFFKVNDIVSEDFDYYFRHLKLDLRGAFMVRMCEITDELAQKLMKCGKSISAEKAKFAAHFAVGGFITSFFAWKTDNAMPIEDAAKLVSAAADECVKGVILNKAV